MEPNYLLGRTTIAQVEIERGNFDRALAEYDAALRLTTDVEAVNVLAGRALAQARARRVDEAKATLRVVDSLTRTYSPTAIHTAVYIAQAYAALRDVNHAVSWLTRYPTQRDLHYQLHLRCDPPFAPIAKDRRFQALLIQPPRGGGC
ncbi:MAG TPA: hypothetical protein VFJ20_02750 [Gemmatimonadaceae bacterium]|nr:hypothetical protein [Gemmatimonadaceae bacterium]